MAEAKPEDTAPDPAPEAIPGATDPELERQVKEDLERVQELMARQRQQTRHQWRRRPTNP